ncbi:DUF4360 domain-containing protein [Pseudonocardiaceae bacterium YIM PH 21723]|nr:DUF4360 domain-containing protein [Pseudonocardiaceae bacterium YIM PH 21723]
MAPLLAVAGLMMSLITPTAPAVNAPPPGAITVKIVTVNGTGCKAGTAAVAVSNDKTTFTVTYSNYLAQAGKGTPATDFRKNCQLNLKVTIPGGYTYAIIQADYRGFASLKSGASGLQQANYYFAGLSPTEYRKHTISGPKDDNWQFTDTTDVAAAIYRPCGEDRNFNINTELRVTAKATDPVSFLAMDSTDVDINTRYHFAFKKC